MSSNGSMHTNRKNSGKRELHPYVRPGICAIILSFCCFFTALISYQLKEKYITPGITCDQFKVKFYRDQEFVIRTFYLMKMVTNRKFSARLWNNFLGGLVMQVFQRVWKSNIYRNIVLDSSFLMWMICLTVLSRDNHILNTVTRSLVYGHRSVIIRNVLTLQTR